MKKFLFRSLHLPVIAVALLCSGYRTISPTEADRTIVGYTSEIMQLWHYSPKKLNDDLSEQVFHAFLKQLDNSKSFFSQEDIDRLGSFRFMIDDNIRNSRLDFYTVAINLYLKRCEEAETYCKEILSKPFNFGLEESIELDPDKTDWPANKAAVKDEWRKRLKYQTLTRLVDAMTLQEKQTENHPDTPQKSVADMEKEAREKVQTLYNDVFRRIESRKDSDWFSMFVNALTSVFDAHSRYLSPEDKTSFDIDMTGQLEGIGATLQQREDYVKVTDIVPGSPSWLQGELKVNDLIMKVRQENQTEEEATDLFGMPLEDAVKLIRGKKGTVVTLTVKHADGTMADISITRDVVIIEETYAKSAVLTDENRSLRVGYIYLPKFYEDFNNTATGRSSSKDVAAEVRKLKEEQVRGIILDLRNNTGGALTDAIEMGGLFIKDGPIVQVKGRNGMPRIYQDPDRQCLYDGPMIVLVNALSASASEIVAAALQDYGRAVIVGGASTFGKGTVQTVLAIEDVLPNNLKGKGAYGSLIFTIQKFFRINGGATQLKGVIPDIQLPDLYSELHVSERDEDYCLPWSEIEPVKFTRVSLPYTIDDIRKASRQRTDQDEDFATLAEQTVWVKKWNENTNISLHMETYRNSERERTEESKKFDEFSDKEKGVFSEALSVDLQMSEQDSTRVARTESWLKSLRTDLYLKECLRILSDMGQPLF